MRRFKQLLFIFIFFSFVIFCLRIKVIGLVLNATNLHYCLSRDRMKFGILAPKDRFVQDMCQQETFHHRGQGATIKKASNWKIQTFGENWGVKFLDREVILFKSVARVARAGSFFG